MYDVVVIGGGIIGTFICRELSKYNLNIALLEKDNDVANGTTKANSAIVHAGYDAEEGTLKAKFNVEGNSMFQSICDELDVSFKNTGSLVIAKNEEEISMLDSLLERGVKNGVLGLKILRAEEVKRFQPNINRDIKGALYAPSCGIVCPFELAIALGENAMDNGARIFLNSKVTNLKNNNGIYEIEINNGEKLVQSKCIVNAAGVYGDEINNIICKERISIRPRRGEYFILDKSQEKLVSTVIFQCPTKEGKGIIVAPTVHGNILIGPNADNIDNKENNETTFQGLQFIKNKSKETIENIDFSKCITSFAGLRASSTKGDFIIEESKENKGFINVVGIESPGLASSPAIAKYAVEKLVLKFLGGSEKKSNFNPRRRRVIRFNQLDFDEKNDFIKENKAYGKVICRCENVTEGEIIDCIKRNLGATTVDGVKRRCRPGMGRCQGGFCGPRIVEILSKIMEEKEFDILKSNKGSYMLSGESKINVKYNHAFSDAVKGGEYDEG